jgi:cytochrome d ubiquinol oxidase subunit I
MFNAATPAEIIHMTLSAFAATGFAVAGIHAFALLRGTPHRAFHRAALQVALVMGIPAAMLQPFAGDFSARGVAKHQPVKLAAMEGHLRSGPASLMLGGWLDPETLTHRGSIEIPGALSFMLHGDRNASVPGLDAVSPTDRPPVMIVHSAFQVMVSCGMLMAALGAWSMVRWWRRRRGIGSALPDDRPFLRAVLLASPLGFVALEAGWTVTEVGRQPWIMQGVMRTADSVTPMPGLVVSFVLFSLLYVGLAITVLFLLWRQIIKTGMGGPSPLTMTSELSITAMMPTRVYPSVGD